MAIAIPVSWAARHNSTSRAKQHTAGEHDNMVMLPNASGWLVPRNIVMSTE